MSVVYQTLGKFQQLFFSENIGEGGIVFVKHSKVLQFCGFGDGIALLQILK
jgi:hypothetical protein